MKNRTKGKEKAEQRLPKKRSKVWDEFTEEVQPDGLKAKFLHC